MLRRCVTKYSGNGLRRAEDRGLIKSGRLGWVGSDLGGLEVLERVVVGQLQGAVEAQLIATERQRPQAQAELAGGEVGVPRLHECRHLIQHRIPRGPQLQHRGHKGAERLEAKWTGRGVGDGHGEVCGRGMRGYLGERPCQVGDLAG